jgi:hypothetical protein
MNIRFLLVNLQQHGHLPLILDDSDKYTMSGPHTMCSPRARSQVRKAYAMPSMSLHHSPPSYWIRRLYASPSLGPFFLNSRQRCNLVFASSLLLSCSNPSLVFISATSTHVRQSNTLESFNLALSHHCSSVSHFRHNAWVHLLELSSREQDADNGHSPSSKDQEDRALEARSGPELYGCSPR